MKTLFELDSIALHLHRYPLRKNETLQAWDAGDEYLIKQVSELHLPEESKMVILNDHFGALSCFFSQKYQVTTMSDSYISHCAIKENLNKNNHRNIQLLTTMDDIPSNTDVVLMQLPKNNRHLIWQLSQLRKCLADTTTIITVGKVKSIHTSTLNLFEHYLGKTRTSLAWKKHRLIYCNINKQLTSVPETALTWKVDNETIQLFNLPNVFSGDRLDIGARFLLEHLPTNSHYQNIIDLGCGNGVLSVKLAQLNPTANILAIDESYMAVESAKINFTNNINSSCYLKTMTNNCLDGIENEWADCIVCNPPFHQQSAITDHIAWQMFCDSHNVMKKQGELYVIGNRHLNYDAKLIRIFGKNNVKTIAQNNKFVILQATK